MADYHAARVISNQRWAGWTAAKVRMQICTSVVGLVALLPKVTAHCSCGVVRVACAVEQHLIDILN
jgi:hypothetical protein